ncbi:hypothetical protein SAMN05720489_2024 [Fibrobacter sp. UWB13]|nr:hypothetical protein SAMN05720489_2024 [Fibrobacter sp. UWB13]
MNNQSIFAKVRSVLILLVSLLAVSTVWAEDPSQETIKYIGWNGEETLTEEFIVLAAASSSSVSSSSGAASSSSSMPEWYVVKGEVFYDCSDFNFAGQRVNLLLMDGAKLTVTNGDEGCAAEFLNLNIYAQSLGDDMGRFEVPSLKVTYAINVLSGAVLTTGNVNATSVCVNNGSVSIGGNVEANSVEFQNGSVSVGGGVVAKKSVEFENGFVSIGGDIKAGAVEFENGSVSVGGGIEAKHVRFYNGTVVVTEGVSAVSDADTVSACIQFASATVRANSYSVSNLCEAKVGNNLLYGDEQGNAYSGTLSAEQLALMAGKTVAPAKWLTFVDGSSVSTKAWIPGVIPSEPTRIWKKFLGWYADKSYKTLFDFTNFESGDFAYAKWENLVNVTYIDGNGQEQTLTEDYTVLVAASSSSVASSSGAASSSSRISSSSGVAPSSSSISSSGSVSSSSNTTEWYVVSGEVSYDCSDFDFTGKDVNLILMDGAKLTVTNSNNEKCAEFESLFIYAQSLGKDMGKFEVSSLNAGYLIVDGGSISIKGSLEADYVTFEKGSVVVDGGIILNEGELTSVNFSGATVKASFYTIPEYSLWISTDLVYGDEQGNAYRSYLSTDQIASMAGKMVAPAKMVKFVDGSSVSEKAWIPGVIPSNPTHIWKKFLGWYTGKSSDDPLFDFTNFQDGDYAYARWENLVEVTYIDEYGVTQTLEDNYTVLVASSPSSSSSGAASSSSIVSSSSSVASSSSNTTGWYVVSGEVLYDCEDFKFSGAEVNLILMDGAKLTVDCNSNEGSAEFGDLNIYAQSLGKNMGEFEVSSLKTDALSVCGGSILIGSSIEADMFEFINGSVIVDGDVVVKESDKDFAAILFAGATVWANSYSIPEGSQYVVMVYPGLVYVDEKGNEYRNTLDADQIALMAGKTLSLAKTITFVDGSSVSEKVWVPGVDPGASTRYLGTFVGWYADKSYQTPFDFTNFESGATAYAKWEDLVEITYIDENGVTQTLTEDYTALVPTSSSSTPGAANSGSSMGVSFTPSDGWYVVSGKMYYNCSDFNFAGKNVNLILMDDAWLTFECNNSEGSAEFGNLTIYAQSLGKKMGGLSLALNDANKKLSLNVADKFVVNGGRIWADAIETSNAEFNKGSVAASGEIVIKETDEDFAGIKLAGATVQASMYIIPGGDKYSIAVAPDLVYVDEPGNAYSETLNAEQIALIAHKNLYPAKMVKFVVDDADEDKPVILGKIPCTPVAKGKKFRWYADKSYQELFDFTNFNSPIAYGLWEDLTEVTYLDENGEEQSVTPDYELVGTECADSELFTNGGWVLVNSEVSYKNNFAFAAPTLHLILADDAKLTVENNTLFENLTIYAQSTGVNQGVFEVNADSYSAIDVDDALTINGGVVKATGEITGIGGSSVKINDGVVKAFGRKQAIYAHGNSLVVNGGTVEAHATGERPESGSGLSSLGNVDINGGTVTATGGYAINANGNVTIAGGKVNATSSIYYSEENCACFGIGSYGSDVYLKGGTVTALAEDGCRGIYADNSKQMTIYLSGATVKASSYNDSILVANDMSYYDDLGNSYTGIIHEEGLLELADKYVYPPALVITKNAEDKMVATLDGNFDKDMPVVITQETTVDEVKFNRGFTAGRYATVMFPFEVYADNLIGAEHIDSFSRMDTVKNDKGVIIRLDAKTLGVWDKPAEAPAKVCDNLVGECDYSTLLKANTPYIVQLEKGHTSLEIRGPVKLVTNEPEFAVRRGDWEFVGVYQYKKWAEGDAELIDGRAIYGFVGVAGDGFVIGDFVRGKAGAYISPLRAYLRYNPLPNVQNVLAVKKVARYNVADWKSASITSELPETITVVREGEDENGGEHTTVIGQINTRSGKFALPRSANREFDLKGRAYGKDARKARGAYYGKKVLKK